MPVTLISLTAPWSTSDMNCERLTSCTFCAELAFFTTCHNATAANKITTQKMIVLTVEFTKRLLRTAAQPVHPISPEVLSWRERRRRTYSLIKLDAHSGIWIDKMPLPYSTPLHE